MSDSSQGIQTPAAAAKEEDDHSNNPICKLCRRQFSKYTCPSCNVPYCSLVCFRSPHHSQCSETFYKSQLKSEIASVPSRTTEERRQMMELLKRFEESAAEDEDIFVQEALGAGNDQRERTDGEVSLVERFSGLDLDALSSEEMWEMLMPGEREQFVKALEDPACELAQRLLSAEQIEHEIEQPWWMSDGGQVDSMQKPNPLHVLKSMVKPVPQGHPLVYNLCAICIAYSYIVRHLGTRMLSTLAPSNPDFDEALRLINLLLPFLLDHRSTTLHASVGEATTDVYSRLEMGKVNSELLALLLEDTATLTKPLRVLSLPSVPSQSAENKDASFVDISTHSLLMPILVLSDMSGFFCDGQEKSDRPSFQPRQSAPTLQGVENRSQSGLGSKTDVMKSKSMKRQSYQHTIRKLEFYISHILATPIGIMERISEEASRWSQKILTEGRHVASGMRPEGVERVRDSLKPLVEELG